MAQHGEGAGSRGVGEGSGMGLGVQLTGAMLESGPRAVWDFLEHAPTLGYMHLKKEFRSKTMDE